MVIPALVFVISLAGTAALYWLLVARHEQQARHLVRSRIHAFASAGVTVPMLDLVKGIGEASTGAAVPLVERLERLAAREIERAGLRTKPTTLLWTTCGLLVAPAAVLALAGRPGLGLVLGTLLAALPWLRVRHARARRIAGFEKHFPEAVDVIARALRAGHALSGGLVMVAEEVPEPVATEFRLLYEHQNYGLPLAEALYQFAERVPLVDARFFATAVLVQREVGGNLSEVLDNLSAVIRNRFHVKRQVRALTAHGRITGWILGLMPLALAALMSLLNPEHARLLIDDPLGIRMVLGAAALQVVGMFLVRKIVNVEY